MPRLHASMDASKYRNLRTLLNGDRTVAKETILQLQEDSKQVIEDIEEEMIRLHGYKWKIWTGFHSVPSMDHLHMHIMSSDLISQSLKNKKHYNSFHPDLGFFLHLDTVIEWFEGEDSYYQRMAQLPVSQYESLLKTDLQCWRCELPQKNIPTLKAHLQKEWEDEKAKALATKKRKREQQMESVTEEKPDGMDQSRPKKQKVDGTGEQGETEVDESRGAPSE
ncbi:hypothetical protein CPB86DRAFT_704435 [Serendipita vermifera]|nr:hypothetical protein CPB86DRAFT_704435 [Serendipita vermifera]